MVRHGLWFFERLGLFIALQHAFRDVLYIGLELSDIFLKVIDLQQKRLLFASNSSWPAVFVLRNMEYIIEFTGFCSA